MSYGLYDYDLRFYKRPMFNLELMKLAAYYKRKREIVSGAKRFTPSLYTNFIVGKDYRDEKFSLPIYEYDNITVVGRFFSPNKYHPLDLAIEKQKADTSIYHNMAGQLTNADEEVLRLFMRCGHLRLSLDGENVWDEVESQIQGIKNVPIILYDYDLHTVEYAIDTIQQILKYHCSPYYRKIAVKFPITITSINELDRWLELPFYSKLVSFNFEPRLTNDMMNFFAKSADRIKNKKFIYNITKNITYEDFTKALINTLFRQISFLRTLPIDFRLFYEEEFFEDKRWKDVIDLFNRYIRTKTKARTMYRYIKKMLHPNVMKGGIGQKQSLLKTLMFVKEHNYELFKDFYEYEIE